MILSRNWLNEFVDLKDITDKEFNDEMTLSGSKVETIERPDENLKNVVVGKILEMKRHENSDHMWVCQVDVGGDAPIQIVTGAQNQQVGDMVPVALDGSLLPDGKETVVADFIYDDISLRDEPPYFEARIGTHTYLLDTDGNSPIPLP